MKFKRELLYNGDRKVRYLETCRYDESTKAVIEMWFRQTAKIENQESCDLADFTRRQVIDLYKCLNSKSKSTLMSVSTLFSDYYNWCIAEGFVDSRNFNNQYDNKMIASVIKKVVTTDLIKGKFINKNQMLNYLDIIPDPVNRFIVYALYLGVYGNGFSDLINLQLKDIDENKRIVNLISGRQQQIDDLFIKLAKEADAQIKYAPEGATVLELKENNLKRYDYDPSCYIIKSLKGGTVNMLVDKQGIMSRLRLMQKQTGNKLLNGMNLYKSGMINFITEHFELKGISFKDALMTRGIGTKYIYVEEIQKCINDFGCNITVNSLRLQIGDYMELFE